MTISVAERQNGQVVIIDNNMANAGSGANIYTVKVPPGTYMLATIVDTITAFNAVSTNTITISDGTNTIVSAESVASTGRETVDIAAGLFYPNGATLTVTFAETGTAATAGRALVVFHYAVVGRSNENYG